MLNGFTIFMLAVVVIGIPVIGGLLYAAHENSLKHKEKMAGALNAQAAEKAAQYAAHTERLEQRVRVLERIVTDRGIDVAAEIEQLRDHPPLN
jgi:putative NADPH-quinone reductase